MVSLETSPSNTGIQSMDDLLNRHASEASCVSIRSIDRASGGIYALKIREKSGVYKVPPVDVYRFNIQLSGQQRLAAFSMGGMRDAAPESAPSGTISFVPAGMSLRAVTEGDDFNAFRLLIPRWLIHGAFEQVFRRDAEESSGISGYVGAPTQRIHQLAHLLHDEFQGQRGGDVLMMEGLAKALCVELVREFGTSGIKPQEKAGLSQTERLHILALFDKAVDGYLSLKDIADRLGIEPYGLSRKVRSNFGEAPRRLLMRKRLERASRMLESGDAGLADISAACGFSSQSHMTTSFTKQFGITPARYRESCLSNSSEGKTLTGSPLAQKPYGAF